LRALRRRARQSLPSGTSYPPYSDGQTNAPCAEALHCAAVIFCVCCVCVRDQRVRQCTRGDQTATSP
jgi:hypothetical protein